MKPFEISPDTNVAHVSLNVYSIQRALDFYQGLLGFQLIGKASDENAILSVNRSDNEEYLLHLSKTGKQHRIVEGERSSRRAGLYHFAILLPSRRYLANVFKHLTENSNELCFEGAADHLVSESLYLRDPDSNGVEIYRDRNQSDWKRIGRFQVVMSTDYLNLEQLLREADDPNEWHMPAKTIIGHVHLHVSNLIKSKKFYSTILGLHNTCTYPRANFFAADSYHHHVATNTWLGNDIHKADFSQPGLDHFALKLDSKQNYERLVEQLRRMKIQVLRDDNNKINKDSIFIYDPDGIKIQIYYR
jgi:catechol 2,3-dioxygenase